MKRLIFLELIFLFLATTFSSNPPPPGWYQQSLPVSDQINDIFFLDSLNGWLVTPNGYILNTQNGGDNWSIQKDSAGNLYSVQFMDSQTGYVLGNGNHGIIYKTTNSGSNWNLTHDFNPAGIFRDMSFVNKDTGWVCSVDNFDGGVFKTTDGGNSWVQQFNYGPNNPHKIFFINTDTGWTSNGSGRKLYKTINGGMNWNLQYTFSSDIGDVFFNNSNEGFISSARMYKSTNGGNNWTQSQSDVAGDKIDFVSDLTGWAGVNFFLVSKTTDGGINWYYQSSPIFNNSSINGVDSLRAWAGGNGLVRTTDGGGLVMIVKQISTEIPSGFTLYQNYPNPFNPVTNLEFEIPASRGELKLGIVSLKVYDMLGKEVAVIVKSKLNPGTYKYEFDGSNFTSGIYFYRIEISDEKSNIINSETKKMILTK